MNNESTSQWTVKKQGWLYHLTPSSLLRLRPSTCLPRYFLLYTTDKSDYNLHTTSHPKNPSKSLKVCYLAMFEQRSDARPPYCTPLTQLELSTTSTDVYTKNNSEKKHFLGITTPNINASDVSSIKERRSSMMSVSKKDDECAFTIKTSNGKWRLQCADAEERDDWIQAIHSTIQDLHLNNQINYDNSIESHNKSLQDQSDDCNGGSVGIRLFGVNVLRVDEDAQLAFDNQLYVRPSVDVGMKPIIMMTDKMEGIIKEHQQGMQARANGT